MAERKILRLLAYDEKLWAIRWQEATWVLSIALLFNLILLRRIADHNVSKLPKMSPLRALKSPQKFRTPGCSSANFLGSWYISGLKSKSCYETWNSWYKKLTKNIQSCFNIFTVSWNGIRKSILQNKILISSLKYVRNPKS